ncbi:MAG: DegV family protein [Lachnospiraceae bacterium]|nr:DegV family protein [Lachnospiraceae bacterium]
MSDYRIITDASVDVVPGTMEDHPVEVIPMEVSMTDGKMFMHYYDYREMSAKDFYQALRNGVMASTSQITPQRYIDFFTPILEKGEDFIYLALSGGLSQTYSASVVAIEELKNRFPDRKMYTFDSLGASGGLGLMVLEAQKQKERGRAIDDVAKWVEDIRLNVAYTWTVDNLMHLSRGGRVKTGTAIIGTALNIKPYGNIDSNGSLPMLGKCRGKKSSLNKLFEMMKNDQAYQEGDEVLVQHCDCQEDADALKKLILDEFPGKKVYTVYTGPVVGAHLGPGSITLFYWAKDKR